MVTQFLAIPLEIRLDIYKELLISYMGQRRNPAWAVGDTDQRLITLPGCKYLDDKTIYPQILRTCKQIYGEGNPILYSENVFSSLEPSLMVSFIEQIGLKNTAFIKKLDIHVGLDLSSWSQLFLKLAEQAGAVRELRLHWGFVAVFRFEMTPEAITNGQADAMAFLHALRRIPNLDKIIVTGQFRKEWWPIKEIDYAARMILGIGPEEHEERELNAIDLQFFRDSLSMSKDKEPRM
ncbi:uncharacterized protein PV09_09472 [Verruconis gallopava]|uniref:Uncharacterized protein n=1 Tax=Verruconis gallopava TaxID=253628 RepID=A0A0D1X9E0_9PEZI|nr:uncharacterized protein PV09_09472 [Verruconis gallopava]KIV98775.1 hypothetical protein PV09_09472 [Verruconis gallopava]